MKRRWILLLAVGILLGALSGCGKNKDNSEQETEKVIEEVAEEMVEAAEAEPIEEPEEEEEEEIVFSAADLVCALPKDFEMDPDEEGLYIHKKYPMETATISHVISESDFDITTIPEEEFKQKLEEDFYSAYGDKVTVNITEYKNIRIDGRKGIRIKMDYGFKGEEYEQLMYMIFNGEESHILNYTQEKGDDWMEEFEKSGDSIKFSN